jgi:hypothetical protein
MRFNRHASLLVLAFCACAIACGSRSSLSVNSDRSGGATGSAGAGIGGGVGSGGGDGGSAGSAGSAGSGECEPEVFATDGSGGVRLEVDATHAYFTTAEHRIVRAQFGGGPEEILVEGGLGVGDIALFGDYLYFSDATGIARVPKAGGVVELLTPIDKNTSFSIVADESGVYWVDGNGGIFGHSLERLSPDGVRTTLADKIHLATGISIAGDRILIAATGFNGSLDAYGVVGAAPKVDGGIQMIAQDVPRPKLPFAHGDHIYWIEETDEAVTNHGGIARAPAFGGAREKMVGLDGQFPIGASTDGERYYLTAILPVTGLTGLMVASFPEGGQAELIMEGGPGEFFTEVQASGERIVWTVQRVMDAPDNIASVRVICKKSLL